MKRLSVVVAFLAIPLLYPNLHAQENLSTTQSISLQPIFWIESVLPREWIGVSGQYELGVAVDRSLTWRMFWLRMARMAFGDATGLEAVGISAEYRIYLVDDLRGWHLGPFVEGSRCGWRAYDEGVFGSYAKNVFDFGIQVGHKWISKHHVSFDISVRAAWFSHSVERGYATFLPRGDLEPNGHLLVSIGYAF